MSRNDKKPMTAGFKRLFNSRHGKAVLRDDGDRRHGSEHEDEAFDDEPIWLLREGELPAPYNVDALFVWSVLHGLLVQADADPKAKPKIDLVCRMLRDDLEVWQRLNVTAFLVSGIGQRDPQVIGEPYADADGTEYLPMFRQPVLVFEGSKETLTKAHERAISRGVALSVFTADLFVKPK